MTGTVRITHPFHPQCGQEIEVVARRPQWGEDRAFHRLADGSISSVPACWTSLVPEDAIVALTRGRAPFRVADLIELTRLVSRLKA